MIPSKSSSSPRKFLIFSSSMFYFHLLFCLISEKSELVYLKVLPFLSDNAIIIKFFPKLMNLKKWRYNFLLKVAWEDQSRDIVFIFALIFFITIEHINSISSTSSGWNWKFNGNWKFDAADTISENHFRPKLISEILIKLLSVALVS